MERLVLVALVGLLAYLVYLVFSPFLVPLAWGAVLTIMFFPAHRRVRRYLRRENLAAVVTTLLLTAVIIAPALLIAAAFTTQALEVAERVRREWEQGRMPLHELWRVVPFERIFNWLAEHNIQQEDLQEFVTKNLERIARFTAAQLGGLARNLLLFVFDLFVALFASFYLFRDGPQLMDRLRRALPLDEARREGAFFIAHNVLYASVFSSIVVAAVQGVLGGLVFWILGISAAVLWGVVMAFFSLLPVLGAWVVWIPAALAFVIQGEYVKALVLVAVGAAIIGMVDNVLRPILISGRAQLNGLLVFISILGGIAAFGVLGIVLGPILVALADAALEAYTATAPTPPAVASN